MSGLRQRSREGDVKVGIFAFQTDSSLDVALLAQKAEETGFDSFWVPEHTILPVHTTSPWPGSAEGIIPKEYSRIVDPFVALGRASAVTRTIKLGTGVCLVPERNPLVLAKEVATLDHLSSGRFLFGIGAGWLKEESEILGGDFPHRWTQTREAVQAMKELWTKPEPEFHGMYYQFPPVRLFPKPAQKPHPPILLGSTAPNVFKRVVEWADGWMPVRATVDQLRQGRATLNELAARAGRDPRSIQVLAFGVSGRHRHRDGLRDLQEAGVDHAIIWLRETEGPAALEEIDRLGHRVRG